MPKKVSLMHRIHDDVVVPCSGNVAPYEVIPVAGTDMQYLSQVGSD